VNGRSRAVLIGIGNPYRRDDGIGPALVAAIRQLDLPGVSLVVSDGQPNQLLDAWSGAGLAVLVDAVRREPTLPGRIYRAVVLNAQANAPDTRTEGLAAAAWGPDGSASTHRLGIPDAVRLGEAMGRLPQRLVAFAVEAADIGYGPGLSAAVAASLPDLTQAVLTELRAG